DSLLYLHLRLLVLPAVTVSQHMEAEHLPAQLLAGPPGPGLHQHPSLHKKEPRQQRPAQEGNAKTDGFLLSLTDIPSHTMYLLTVPSRGIYQESSQFFRSLCKAAAVFTFSSGSYPSRPP